MPESEVSRKRITEVLDYNPETGVFNWKIQPARRWKNREQTGSLSKSDGYIRITIDGHRCAAHRIAWMWVHGKWPEGQIDHINHDRSDNRIENLRDVTVSENRKNQIPSKANTSGVTGVSWAARDKRWTTRITVNGKTMSLGNYKDFKDAVSARKAASKKYGFHENHGKMVNRCVS